MTVLFKKSPSGPPFLLAYNAGDIADIDDVVALALIKAEIAETITQDTQAKPPHQTAQTATSPQAKKAEKR